MKRWYRALVASAGVLGASGVGVGAASAHLGGGSLSSLASEFLLIHASAIVGVVGLSRHRPAFLWSIPATMLAVGAAFFAVDLAVLDFLKMRLIQGLAPTGGLLMITGWLGLGVAAIFERDGGTTPL